MVLFPLFGLLSNFLKMKTDLVLVCHNSLSDLERFLPSIKANTENYNLIIVDNGEQKLTIEFLEKLTAKYISTSNNGYGTACNVGAKAGDSEFIVFLNCDLLATKNWLENLLKPFADPAVAVTGARLFNEQGLEYKTPERGHVIGCCYAIRRKVFEQLGGFDENFFLFFEETDLSLRATKAGFYVVRSDAKLIHFHPHFLPMPEHLQKYYDISEKYFKNKHNL
jgi:GT2 family glycosyltransferase